MLGGAGKTPVAIAVARALARLGGRVALIGHAYGGSLRAPRFVAPDDAVREVGDDALAAARLLASDRIPVVVAPSRTEALAYAARAGATMLVADGLLQAAPVAVLDAVLVVDAEEPWGGGACPPLGDLRAPPAALLDVADHIAVLGRGPDPLALAHRLFDGLGRPGPGGLGAEPAARLCRCAVGVASGIAGASGAGGERWELATLARQRVGLLLAIARPHRIEKALAAHGIVPIASQVLSDHAVFTPRAIEHAARAPVEVWLTTARCAVKLPPRIGGAPVLALEHHVDVGALVSRLVIGSRACDSEERS